MSELDSNLEFYKYFKELDPEHRWIKDKNGNDELIVFLYWFQIEDFLKLWEDHSSVFDDGGIEAKIGDGYIVFDLGYMLEYVGLNPEEIVPKDEDL